MYNAISTACLYPLETEKSLAALLKIGFRRFEFFLNCESEFSDEFLSLLVSMLKPYGARVCSVHLYTSGLEPYMFFSDYPRRFNDSLELYSRYFEKAAGIGAGIVVFHGDRKGTRLPLEEFCERFTRLSDKAADCGVVLAQENVSRCRSASVKAVRDMKSLLKDRIKFVLDIKQALRAGESPFDMCDAMGENIACVHISDSSQQSDCLLPGAGTFDFSSLRSQLSGYSFSGPLTVEVYRSSFKTLDELYALNNFLSNCETY